MASLTDRAGMARLLAHAESIGLTYAPLSVEEIDALANDPFAYEAYTIIEHKGPNEVSGYYQMSPHGWALVAVGPSLNTVGATPLREWNAIPKGEGWATRLEVARAMVSDTAEVGDIVYNVADNGIVRLAECLAVDKSGYPTRLNLMGMEIDPQDVEGMWEKAPGREEAARWLYDQGKREFINAWTYKTQLGRRAKIIAGQAVKTQRRDHKDTETLTKMLLEKDDAAFKARIAKARNERLKQEKHK